MKFRNSVLLFSALILQGCSFLVDLALFNNSDEMIEICNLNLAEATCQVVELKSLAKVLIVGDQPANSWRVSIARGDRKDIYELAFGPYPEHASEVYCEGIFQKRCDIPVQYESSGLLYWGGKYSKLPVEDFPNQPKGFPVEPSA